MDVSLLLLLSHDGLFNTEADWLMVLIFCHGQFKSLVFVSETASCRLTKDIRTRVTNHLVSLVGNFLLHPLWADLNVQILLKTTAHGLERAYLLGVHLLGILGVSTPNQELSR